MGIGQLQDQPSECFCLLYIPTCTNLVVVGPQLECNPWTGTPICSRREHGARAELWHDGKSVSYMYICHWSNDLIRHSSHREGI